MKQSSTPSRREFLKTAASILAGGALISTGACTGSREDQPLQTSTAVRRTLGHTGLTLPVISMGSCYAINLVETALDRGIVYIHTSSGYAEHNHERLLGRVFKNRPRDSFVIATSPDLPYTVRPGGIRSNDVGMDVDPALILESIDGSLQRLGLDYVDIYYLVSAGSREVALNPAYIEAYRRLKQEGKIRFAGIGTHENEPEVIRAAAESGFWEVVLTAYNFRQSHRKEIRAAIRRAAEAGLGVVAMKTQAGVYWDRKRERMINMKAALKWVLSDANVHTAIPAFSNYDEMMEDLSIMEQLELMPEEREDLGLGDRLGLSGCYCQQCRRCASQCPSGVDIATLMRAYMYAFGHGRPGKARDILRNRRTEQMPCRSCSNCPVQCALGFDVRSRALEIEHLLRSEA